MANNLSSISTRPYPLLLS